MMRRQALAALLLIGLLIAGRVATRVWGASPEQRGTTHGPVSSFIMTIEGDTSPASTVGVTVVGDAGFRRQSSKNGGAFSLELGTASRDATVLFAADGVGPQGTGRFTVDDRPGSGAMHALIVIGSPDRPRAVYRAASGTVTLRQNGQGQMEGNFELEARGFPADHPLDEQHHIRVAGSFLALER